MYVRDISLRLIKRSCVSFMITAIEMEKKMLETYKFQFYFIFNLFHFLFCQADTRMRWRRLNTTKEEYPRMSNAYLHFAWIVLPIT